MPPNQNYKFCYRQNLIKQKGILPSPIPNCAIGKPDGHYQGLTLEKWKFMALIPSDQLAVVRWHRFLVRIGNQTLSRFG